MTSNTDHIKRKQLIREVTINCECGNKFKRNLKIELDGSIKKQVRCPKCNVASEIDILWSVMF